MTFHVNFAQQMKIINYLKTIGAVCISLFVSSNAFSQQSPYFYKKGVYPEKKLTVFDNAIKTDLVSLASGDLSLLYERRFSDRFGLEGGAGFLLQPTRVSSYVVVAQRINNFKSNSGFSLLVSPRLYGGLFPNTFHCILVKVNHYKNLTIGEIAYGFGYIYSFSDKFFIESSFHAGLLQQWSSESNPNYMYCDDLDNPYKGLIFQIKLSIVIGFAIN